MSERMDEVREPEEVGQAESGEGEEDVLDPALGEAESSQSEEEVGGDFVAIEDSEEEEEEEEEHPVFNLLMQDKVEAVRELLATNRTLVHRLNSSGHDPIHYAAWGQGTPANIDMVKLLLSHGALVDSRGYRFATPLHLACLCGREKMCELLLTNGARYDLTLNEGNTSALHLAGNVEVVKVLIR